MTATEATVGLTALDLKAMRAADRVVLMTNYGKSLVRCVKTARKKGPFSTQDAEYDVTVGHEIRRISHEDSDRVRASTLLYADHYDGACVWKTVCAFVKQGDELVLQWCPDYGNNGYLDSARIADAPGNRESMLSYVGQKLHADRLNLIVKRGTKRFVFILDESICPDNSARMVRV